MTRLWSRTVAVAFAAALTAVPVSAAAGEPHASCWGQASRVFAATGDMGQHASQQATPRLGLHNLAVALHEAGLISDDSMAALGVFVADQLGLSIDACQ